MKRLVSALCLAVSMPGAALAGDPGVKPGMGLSAVEAALKSRCAAFEVTADADRFVSCRYDGKEDGAFVAITISPKDRAYFVSWREPVSGEAADFARATAAALGFSGPGKGCKLYDYPMLCWTGSDGTVLYSAEKDSQGRYVSYLINEAIEQADTAE